MKFSVAGNAKEKGALKDYFGKAGSGKMTDGASKS